MARKSALSEKLEQVRQEIAEAASAARRDPSEVTLIAVTKYAGMEQIRELLQLGVMDLGENKVQQLQQRVVQINEFVSRMTGRLGEGASGGAGGAAGGIGGGIKPRWHMIGHVQRNKVKPLVPLAGCIHSIDSLRLAEEIDAQAEKTGKKQMVLLQVNASEEPQKSGVAVGAALHLAEQIASMEHVQMAGLMTMAAFDADEKLARFTFGRVRELFEEIKWNKIGGNGFKHLSMGMTNDFKWAIMEGATMIRVGSALFGAPAKVDTEKE